MFKTLFATTLLSLSLSTPFSTVPKKATTPNTLYGMYCLKENFEPLYDTSYEVFEGTIYNWVDTDYGAKCYRYTDSTSHGYTDIRRFDYSVDGTYFSFTISFGEEIIYIDNDYGEEGVQDYTSNTIKYVTLYFPTPTYVDNEAFTVFNSYFSGSPNTYVIYYNGYYNFNTTYPTTSFYGGIYGNFIINNNIYTFLDLGTSEAFAYGVGGSQAIYQNGSFKITDRNMLIQNTLIPQYEYNIMSNRGTFMYVPSTDTNDFADLIFSVMDAPIYYLSSLFSFELFGIQFYVAFMSILTLLLICVVVRKII